MTKRVLSVTLTPDDIAFLRARAASTRARSVSETLDALVSEAGASSSGGHPAQSIQGLVRIAEDDPDLAGADRAVRRLFATLSAARV